MSLDDKSLPVCSRSARKGPTHLSIHSDLRAPKLGIDLFGALEEALVDQLAQQRRRDWIEFNHTAIRSYNRRVETRGSYGDRFRRF